MSGVPDGFASRYVDIRMGRHRVEVNDDLPDFGVSHHGGQRSKVGQ
ncbi:hypothetical protein [Iamia sp.]|nr:hypothetical protein [Iamia sp.]HXH57004.1 hypothetical protein [Iamia sp.]